MSVIPTSALYVSNPLAAFSHTWQNERSIEDSYLTGIKVIWGPSEISDMQILQYDISLC